MMILFSIQTRSYNYEVFVTVDVVFGFEHKEKLETTNEDDLL